MTTPTLERNPDAVTGAPAKPFVGQRLMSVDALRGFDMFWIVGADALVNALHRMTPNPVTTLVADQLEHVEWAGFHFYDLIFPLFVFIVGVSIVFSLGKSIEQHGRGEAVKRIFRRTTLLFAIAILYSGGFTDPWPNMRLLGVLNRIALCYCFASLIFCFFKPRAMIAICAGLLLGYWAAMTFVPIRDIQLDSANLARVAAQKGDAQSAALFKEGINFSIVRNSPAWAAAEKLFYGTTTRTTGKYEKGYNLSNHFDFQYLPGKKWEIYADPEGILSTVPAIATCLLGVFAGLLLKNQKIGDLAKVKYLLIAGVSALILGLLWSFQFPVVKKIWTSSFVLVAGGWSAILLGTFYLVIDVWKKQSWCLPFVWIGMNSITIYLASNLIGGFRKVAARFVGGDIRHFFDTHVAKGLGDLIVALAGLALAFWFVRFLYRRKIFLRL